MSPTLEARTADRAIASLRKAIEELAAERPHEARAMVLNAAGSVATLREMIEAQLLKQPRMAL
jgi:N-acetylglucosamine kinase-like BadF-type ATPase